MVLKFIIRDFSESGLKKLESFLKNHTKKILKKYKKATVRTGKYTEKILRKKEELVAEIRRLNQR